MNTTRLMIAGLSLALTCTLEALGTLQDMVEDMQASVNTRIAGLPGGAASMTMFSTKNHTTKQYVRNVNMWAFDLTDQLTGCAVYKTASYESFGGILITPRHVLYCNHAHPQALGTWGPNLKQICDLVFVDRDNKPIVVTQLHQASESTTADLAVAVLDRDLKALGLHVMPIARLAITRTSLAAAGVTVSSLPMLGMSQGAGRSTSTIPPQPYSDYPQYNDIMLYIKDLYSLGNLANKPYSRFNYGVWDGDSGTPTFILYDNVLYLHTILTTAPWGGVSVPNQIDLINRLIAKADQNAISLGRLSEPTGYTVQTAPERCYVRSVLGPSGTMDPQGVAASDPFTARVIDVAFGGSVSITYSAPTWHVIDRLFSDGIEVTAAAGQAQYTWQRAATTADVSNQVTFAEEIWTGDSRSPRWWADSRGYADGAALSVYAGYLLNQENLDKPFEIIGVTLDGNRRPVARWLSSGPARGWVRGFSTTNLVNAESWAPVPGETVHANGTNTWTALEEANPRAFYYVIVGDGE